MRDSLHAVCIRFDQSVRTNRGRVGLEEVARPSNRVVGISSLPGRRTGSEIVVLGVASRMRAESAGHTASNSAAQTAATPATIVARIAPAITCKHSTGTTTGTAAATIATIAAPSTTDVAAALISTRAVISTVANAPTLTHTATASLAESSHDVGPRSHLRTCHVAGWTTTVLAAQKSVLRTAGGGQAYNGSY